MSGNAQEERAALGRETGDGKRGVPVLVLYADAQVVLRKERNERLDEGGSLPVYADLAHQQAGTGLS